MHVFAEVYFTSREVHLLPEALGQPLALPGTTCVVSNLFRKNSFGYDGPLYS